MFTLLLKSIFCPCPKSLKQLSTHTSTTVSLASLPYWLKILLSCYSFYVKAFKKKVQVEFRLSFPTCPMLELRDGEQLGLQQQSVGIWIVGNETLKSTALQTGLVTRKQSCLHYHGNIQLIIWSGVNYHINHQLLSMKNLKRLMVIYILRR